LVENVLAYYPKDYALSYLPYAYSILRYLPICSAPLLAKALLRLSTSLTLTKPIPLDLPVSRSLIILHDAAEQKVLKYSRMSYSEAS